MGRRAVPWKMFKFKVGVKFWAVICLVGTVELPCFQVQMFR